MAKPQDIENEKTPEEETPQVKLGEESRASQEEAMTIQVRRPFRLFKLSGTLDVQSRRANAGCGGCKHFRDKVSALHGSSCNGSWSLF